MVFSSVPVYLDPPNLQQQTNHQQEVSFNDNINHQFPPLPPPTGGGGAAHHVNNNTSGSIRPGSMAERARFAKIPQPEGPLKCPRCDSTNTKFCYFNNYNLSQPRHFCKTCRRYWTRGGALRNVPVGGGCRRNKKSKSSSSRSSANSAERHTVGNTSAGIGIQSAEVLGHMQQPSPLPFMPSFARFGPGNIGLNNLGLNLSGIHGQFEASNGGSGQAGIEFGAAGSELGSSNLALSTGSMAQWRPQQFPFMAGFEAPIGLYNSLESEGFGGSSSANLIAYSQLRPMTTNSGITQLAPVKMEGNHVPNLPRPSLGIDENSQLWGANSWTNLRDPSSTSTSTSHLS